VYEIQHSSELQFGIRFVCKSASHCHHFDLIQNRDCWAFSCAHFPVPRFQSIVISCHSQFIAGLAFADMKLFLCDGYFLAPKDHNSEEVGASETMRREPSERRLGPPPLALVGEEGRSTGHLSS
jgi:hypothetical protein